MSTRRERITSAWYVQHLDDQGREQMTTYVDFCDAWRAFHDLGDQRLARLGLVYSNGSMQAYAVKEVRQHGEA